MELEDMKKRWDQLDARLSQTQMTNDIIIKEMIGQRSSRSLSNLIGFEVSAIVILPLVMAFCILIPYWVNLHPFTRTFLYTLIPVIILQLIWQVFKVAYLMKVDTSDALIDNIRRINRYKVFIKYEKVALMMGLVPILILAVIIQYAIVGAPLVFWVFAVIMFALVISGSLFSYKRLYAKYIESIRSSLEELRDLEQ